ncbi:MAG: hypothetical protein AAF726_03190 [Planctomycetota bacterium]
MKNSISIALAVTTVTLLAVWTHSTPPKGNGMKVELEPTTVERASVERENIESIPTQRKRTPTDAWSEDRLQALARVRPDVARALTVIPAPSHAPDALPFDPDAPIVGPNPEDLISNPNRVYPRVTDPRRPDQK